MRLDELYRMTAFIYQDANLARSKEATFLHFVEVCALLTETARQKNRSKVDIEGAICKTLGWYFPLLAKMGVESAERLIFQKYPAVCPYCREQPHNEANCKLVKGTELTVDHTVLAEIRSKNEHLVPDSLNGWQAMFGQIYPRNLNNNNFSTIAIFEEIGEIAEAIRVHDRHPHYFYGEAADIFSYIMGFANEHKLRQSMEQKPFDLEAEFLSRYPGMCINCGSRSCVCPPIPAATIGRMTKEMPVSLPDMTIKDVDAFYEDGNALSLSALSIAGNDTHLSSHLPVDRGDLNSALVQLCLRLSVAIEGDNKELSERLRREATEIASQKSERGTLEKPAAPSGILSHLREAWSYIDEEVRDSIRSENQDLDDISRIFDKRILLVTANSDADPKRILRLDREHRAIKQSIRRAGANHRYYIESLTACTIDDLRHSLLDQKFDIIHFSGHANDQGLAFCAEGSGSEILPIDALKGVLRNQDNLQCVVLNACESMVGLADDIAPLVIGMMDEIDDEGAIEFSKGFYDALAAGQTPSECYAEGVACMEAKDFDTDHVVKKTRPS